MKERPDLRRSMYILGVVAICGITLIGQMFWVARNQYRFSPFAIERVRCDECKGTGLKSETDEQGIKRLRLCEACYGLGNHQIRRVDEYDLLCPACAGFGRVEENGRWRWCRRCGGRGLIRYDDAPPPTYQPPVPIYGSQPPTNAEPPSASGDGESFSIEQPATKAESPAPAPNP